MGRFCFFSLLHRPGAGKLANIARNNDAQQHVRFRNALIKNGVLHFTVTTKQGRILFVHTEEASINENQLITEHVLKCID